MSDATSFEVDPDEIANLLETLGRYGRHPEAGMSRLVYTDEWCKAVATVERWLRDDGFVVWRDAVGNLFGRVPGSDGGPVVATGSHIDTALQGGKYDGTAGVVCSYVALRTLLRACGSPKRTLELIAISDEESSRFPSNLWGARAITGRIRAAEANELLDANGISAAEAMRSCGLDPENIASAQRDDIEIFLELHIEQGPILEQANVPVGIVRAITGFDCAEHVVTGISNHAGGTPLERRRDPLQGVAEMVLATDRIAREMGEPARATVGRISAFPGAINIIAARVSFTTDLRHPDPVKLDELVSRVKESFANIARVRDLGLESVTKINQPPVVMDLEIVCLLEHLTDELGRPRLSLHSGGGHDAMIFAQAGVRTGMLFVPSVGGLSHSPLEYTHPRDLACGTQILAKAIHRLAY